ncbi:MAG: hypothetical protein R2748_04965 [Bryobacterales bacterium]
MVRRNVWGVTSGNPIVKNKVFNFFAYERPKHTRAHFALDAGSDRIGAARRLLEQLQPQRRTAGDLRPVHDPDHRLKHLDARRFSNNVIPAISPRRHRATHLEEHVGREQPRRQRFGANNYRIVYPQQFKYYNLSDRVDYNVSDNVKVFYRLSRFKTTQSDPDFTNGSPLQPMAGSARNTWQTSADMVWTINPTAVFSVRGSGPRSTTRSAAPAVEIGAAGLPTFGPATTGTRLTWPTFRRSATRRSTFALTPLPRTAATASVSGARPITGTSNFPSKPDGTI